MMNRIGQQIGTYRLINLLGQGGYADVYLGQQQFLASLYAVKVWHLPLTASNKQEVLSEARIIGNLQHPHIMRIHYFDIETGTNIPFLVMDYAPKGTLRQQHPEGMLLSPETVCKYIEQVADALSYVHKQHNIVHRDIKPENMLVDQQGNILLSDFGIATILPSVSMSGEQKIVGVTGTIDYMAPEMFRKQPCPASDQYALAAVAYEWLCGDVPFYGNTLQAVVRQHLYEPVSSLLQRVPGLPLAVEEVLFRALAKEPEQRFPSILAFAHAFNTACGLNPTPVVLSSQAVKPMTAPPVAIQNSVPSPPKALGRRACLTTIGGVIGLGILYGVGVAIDQQTHSNNGVPPARPSPAVKHPLIASNGLLTPGVLLWGGDASTGGAPYAFLDANSEPVGFEVDIANELAGRMAVTPSFQQITYGKLEDMLMDGHIDIILNGWEVTPGRQVHEIFSIPYYRYAQQLVIRAGDARFSAYTPSSQVTLAELKSYSFGTGMDYKAADLLRSANIKVHTGEQPLDDLKRGVVDVSLLDTPIVAYYVQGKGSMAKPDGALRPIGKPLFGDAISNYAIAFRKSNSDADTLRKEINQALLNLKQDGTLKSIYQKWGLWNDLQQDIGIS